MLQQVQHTKALRQPQPCALDALQTLPHAELQAHSQEDNQEWCMQQVSPTQKRSAPLECRLEQKQTRQRP